MSIAENAVTDVNPEMLVELKLTLRVGKFVFRLLTVPVTAELLTVGRLRLWVVLEETVTGEVESWNANTVACVLIVCTKEISRV